MSNLKYLLRRNRVVEIRTLNGFIMGVVDNAQEKIVNQYESFCIGFFNESLVYITLSHDTITKIYENTPDGLKIIWDRKNFIDWANVAIDTKVQVKHIGGRWENRYFAKYEDGKVYTFTDGATSFSTDGSLIAWDEARLYKEGDK